MKIDWSPLHASLSATLARSNRSQPYSTFYYINSSYFTAIFRGETKVRVTYHRSLQSTLDMLLCEKCDGLKLFLQRLSLQISSTKTFVEMISETVVFVPWHELLISLSNQTQRWEMRLISHSQQRQRSTSIKYVSFFHQKLLKYISTQRVLVSNNNNNNLPESWVLWSRFRWRRNPIGSSMS